MKHVARNLGLHSNGTYYAVFDGMPQSLKTKSRREANQLLADERRERAQSRRSKCDQVFDPACAPGPSSPSAAPELAAIQAALATLASQMAQQNAMIEQLREQRGGVASTAELPEFEDFQKRNLATICSTVAPDSQRMYRGTAKRLKRALAVYQRYERMKAFSKEGRSLEPDLWKIFRDLGPGGIWGYWRNHQKLDNSSLNQFRCYLRAFVEEACDHQYLPERFVKLADKIPILPVPPALPTIPSLVSMSAFFSACRSVNPSCADLVELTSYTGQRPCNMKDIRWEDIDLPARMMQVAQDGERPPVDISPDAMKVLERLKGNRVTPTGPVIKITDRLLKNARSVMKQCVKALAPEYPDLCDMTDLKALRHYFASCCVMAGVDYKTIAIWMGHNDGGVLVAKTYGHLRRGHTKTAMSRVQFTASSEDDSKSA